MSDSSNNITNKAWIRIFSELRLMDIIDSEGATAIAAKQIRSITNVEPHIIAKMDSRDSRPDFFKENDLSLLQAQDGGKYIIGRFDAFIDLDYTNPRIDVIRVAPSAYDINRPVNITRKPEAILTAFNHNMFEDIVVGEDSLKMVSFGRRCTGPLDYSIRMNDKKELYPVKVNNTQIELGGVFENINGVINVEARINQYPDFITQQLYYPFRVLSELTDKKIYNVLLTSSAGSIFTHIYEVKERSVYNSMVEIACNRFDFFEEISISDIKDILSKTCVEDEPSDTVFPQADSIDRIFQTIEITKANPGISAAGIGDKLGLTSRQGGYYSNAGIYLKLLVREKIGGSYHHMLSNFGTDILSKPWRDKNLMMVKAIAKHQAFNHFITLFIENQERPEKSDISNYLRNNIPKLGNDKRTADRRASTVLGWTNWVIQITAEEE